MKRKKWIPDKSKILEQAATKLLKRSELGDKLKQLGKKNNKKFGDLI